MQDAIYKTLLDNLSEGVYFVDRDKRILYWNKAAERMTGRTAGEVLGFCCADNILVHTDEQGANLCLSGCPLSAMMTDGRYHEASVYMLHKDGHRVPVTVKAMPVYDEQGNITGGIETFTDNSANRLLKEQNAHLTSLSLIDELTQAGNRRYANITLETRLSEFKRYGWPFGMIMFDIDNFKVVNDTFGHDAGDKALQMVARSISDNMRSPASLFFRWGGEEFVILASNVNGRQLYDIAERMRILVATSFIVRGDDEIRVTVSAGATIATAEDDAESLTRRADTLLYRSKKEGKNRTSTDSGQPAGFADSVASS
ncbi:PAS domain S-box-containing protein/diguanylate cyclase (GGDEF) domain-containing protein [Dehalogenimonas formicexedens]|uniref:PAS domain S-box-containing protein/diguanylate cyclase (GGDEF) domain-containing protein n=1 Tax=Dehalogenimonas formicexedens TaxID=1839801 RepID=A0A1P8F4X0_9CHLR|nr:GGDEF domain-containing protein [Dehalogenimonas formicexedens]APV43524.1 PAS domain S-box-containing protein/diguanylate cyclase (GGDEF) domain-containing protein [Dehalogenimonas formicexedens]